ncbi:hypothetical protein AArcCO_4130 (plasmid) [Halalkaliarchaeum sp. AArc-CO]|nr:hypothetical protein AArcCO_4130 [Halalkaliarchaeum sp. AArc-CO]
MFARIPISIWVLVESESVTMVGGSETQLSIDEKFVVKVNAWADFSQNILETACVFVKKCGT